MMTHEDACRLAWASISTPDAPLPPRDGDPMNVSRWAVILRVAKAILIAYDYGRRDTWWRRLWRR